MPLVATSSHLGRWHSKGTASDKLEEGAGDYRSVCPESPGLHADYNGWYNRFRLREEKEIPKAIPSSDCGLQLTHMKPESLVIACHHRAVNMSLLLAHTDRQATRVEFGRGYVLWAYSSLDSARRVKS